MWPAFLRGRTAGYVLAILGVVAVTAACVALRAHVNATTAGMAFLLTVLFVAMAWGSWPALVASTFAMLCFNFYFLPPLGTFTIADPENWIALGAFFMTGVTGGQLSARAKRRAAEARRFARLQAALAELGERALRGQGSREVTDHAVTAIAWNLDVDYCKVLELLPGGEDLLLRSGMGWEPALVGHAKVGSGTDSQAGYTLLSDKPVVVLDLRTERRFVGSPLLRDHGVVSGMSVVIVTHKGPYGVLGAHTRRLRRFTDDEVNFLQAVANVLAAAIERERDEERLRRVNQSLRTLSHCNQSLIRAGDEPSWLQQVCKIIVEEAGFRMCWVGYAEQDESKTVRPLAKMGFEQGYLDSVSVTWADTERGQGPTGTCIRERRTVICQDIVTDPRLAPWRAEALRRGYASSIALPLLVDSEAIGSLTIYAAEPNAFGDDDIKLLTELADDLAYGITNLRTRAERTRAQAELRAMNVDLEERVAARTAELGAARQREMTIGFRIQQMLLLDRPLLDVPGLQIAALSIPSQHVDGDFYGFYRHEDQCVDVIVADVMGKGIPAALLGAATKSHLIEALCHRMGASRDHVLPEPKDVVTEAHVEMAQHLIDLESFVTLCYLRVDLGRKRFSLADCGHTGLLQWRAATGSCEIKHGDNLPLGAREGEVYDQISAPLDPGDLLVLFSDGVTEARDHQGELFGPDRLVACVQENSGLSPSDLVEAIRRAAFDFTGSSVLRDDLTCVAIRVVEREMPLARSAFELRSDLRELALARRFVREICASGQGTPLDERAIGDVELAVTEACSNIVKHAYHGRDDQWIRLEAEAYPDALSLRLYYVGEPFDPSQAPPPALDGSRDSGFGVYLITKSVDDVRYSRDERGRNCVSFVKRREK